MKRCITIFKVETQLQKWLWGINRVWIVYISIWINKKNGVYCTEFCSNFIPFYLQIHKLTTWRSHLRSTTWQSIAHQNKYKEKKNIWNVSGIFCATDKNHSPFYHTGTKNSNSVNSFFLSRRQLSVIEDGIATISTFDAQPVKNGYSTSERANITIYPRRLE